MTRGRYVPFSKADFDAFFADSKLVALGVEGGELVYGRHYLDGAVLLKVYTSIDARSGESRDVGEDAIRFTVIGVKHNFPLVAKQRRVNRTAGASLSDADARNALFERVREKLNEMHTDVIPTLARCECGGVLYERASQFAGGRPFQACSGFRATKCRGRQVSAAAVEAPVTPRETTQAALVSEAVTSTPVSVEQAVDAVVPSPDVPADLAERILKTIGVTLTPSKYQMGLFAWAATGTGNAVVEAVAGSGKTTSIVNVLKLLRGRVLFLAFNVSIKKELEERVPADVTVKTLNGFGHGACLRAMRGRLQVENDKRTKAAVRYEMASVRGMDFDNADIRELANAVLKGVNLCKATLIDGTDREALATMLDRYQVDANGSFDVMLDVIPAVIRKLKDVRGVSQIDFSDQVWLPLVNNYPVEKYDWVLVDEAQDLNRSQIELVKRALRPGGRVIAVGDRRQSIYGFRGADSEAIPNLIRELNATVLPLSISYRCPQSVVELAKSLVPQIEASETAPRGEVLNLDFTATNAHLDSAIDQSRQQGVVEDMFLCRTNAPLVNLVYALIRRGKKARIQGRDVGVDLARFVTKIGGTNLVDFLTRMSEYAEKEDARLEALGDKGAGRRAALADKIETISVISESCTTVADLKTAIENIFSDDKEGVICSTVHRAKGLEARRVTIIRPDLMPHKMAKSPWERDQERNLQYVAWTRAKETLVILDDRSFGSTNGSGKVISGNKQDVVRALEGMRPKE